MIWKFGDSVSIVPCCLSVYRQVLYLIKWEGYDEEDNSWEPAENLDCDELVKEFEAEHAKKEQARKEKNREKDSKKSDREKDGKKPSSSTSSGEKERKKRDSTHSTDDHDVSVSANGTKGEREREREKWHIVSIFPQNHFSYELVKDPAVQICFHVVIMNLSASMINTHTQWVLIVCLFKQTISAHFQRQCAWALKSLVLFFSSSILCVCLKQWSPYRLIRRILRRMDIKHARYLHRPNCAEHSIIDCNTN